MRLRLLCIASVLLAGLIACGDTPPEPATQPSTRPGGAEARGGLDFTVTTFEGETFRLAEHRGRPVVLNFWESW